jgi:hypothetical protein
MSRRLGALVCVIKLIPVPSSACRDELFRERGEGTSRLTAPTGHRRWRTENIVSWWRLQAAHCVLRLIHAGKMRSVSAHLHFGNATSRGFSLACVAQVCR